MNEINPYYEAAVNHMTVQLNYLEELIGRELTVDEKDNLHEFYLTLPPNIQAEFETHLDRLV